MVVRAADHLRAAQDWIDSSDSFGDITLSLPTSYLTAAFKLQWASSPAAMNWEEIPNELILINPSSPETAAHFPHQPGSGQKFYRLHRP